MNASQHFKEGRLAQAIDAQIADVKAHPADHGKRLFLFELLVFAGDLERARKHLDILKYDNVEVEASVMKYRRLLDGELERRQVLAGAARPHFLDDVPMHAELRLQALQSLREQQTAEAATLLDEAHKASPAVNAELNGQPAAGLRDCDDLLGNILEVIAHGKYCWIPLEQVELVVMNPPRFPRDLIWAPASLETIKSSAGEVFLPTLYPNSYQDSAEEIKLGRATDFSSTAPVLGRGGKLFLAGEEAVPLLDWRELKVAQP
jgi:type VI secretion system protein ImpE